MPKRAKIPNRLREDDPVRIVPLCLPIEMTQPMSDVPAARAAAPHLTYRGGPLLTTVEVVTIFWGQIWETQHAALVDRINGFFDLVLTSAVLD